MFRWIAKSDDGAFSDASSKTFATKEACYFDMRNAALEKVKWNTEFMDVDNESTIGYEMKFSQNAIIHKSYSGTYVYEIIEGEEYEVCIDVTCCMSMYVFAKNDDDARCKAEENIRKNPNEAARQADCYVTHEITNINCDY